jgi:glucosylceramidase
MSYAGKILDDKEANELADGVAFHDYVGEPVEMSTLHNQYPDKDFYLTERSVWGTYGMDRIIQYFRNWCKCYVAWVTCLDENRQPNSGCHPADPTFVTYNPKVENSWYFIPEYWLVGQISKFIQRGAYRIESNYGSPRDVTNIAFENPDGSIVVIVINQTDEEKSFSVHHDDAFFNAIIPAKTVATYKWKS